MPNNCAVFNCKGGNSRFLVPKDANKRKKWETALGLKFTGNQKICELHFDKEDILYEKEIKDKDGKVIVIGKYERPQLRSEAVPFFHFHDDIPRLIQPWSRYCCVANCSSKSSGPNNRTVLRLPIDPERRDKWLEVLSPHLRSGKQSRKQIYVCDLHFRPQDFLGGLILESSDGTMQEIPRERVRLQPFSVPSIFSDKQEVILVEKAKEFGNAVQLKRGAYPSIGVPNPISVMSDLEPEDITDPLASNLMTDTVDSLETCVSDEPVRTPEAGSAAELCKVIMGDIALPDVISKSEQQRLKVCKSTMEKQRLTIRLLQQQNRRLKAKIKSLSAQLQYLRETNMSSTAEDNILSSLSPP